MSDDDRLDSKIREIARGVHVPPPTPRDEIWARVQANRAARRAQPGLLVGRVRWIVWAAGAAAMLALGVALGRRSMQPDTTPVVAAGAGPTEGGGAGSAAYELAAHEHLSRVETFLTVFTSDASRGALGSEDLELPARQLLRRTRMLQQSPAIGEDVALRTLLDDVEFVLLQIAALSTMRDDQELDFVEQGITERSVMLRLRSALPSGAERRTVGGST